MNLKELAEHLGLSQTTVSRALNGYPEVGEATRRRVIEQAHNLGYRPNAHARRLATGRSHAIGYVFPSDRSIIIDPIFSDFIAGASDFQAMKGFETLLHAGGEEDEMDVYRRYAEGGLVDEGQSVVVTFTAAGKPLSVDSIYQGMGRDPSITSYTTSSGRVHLSELSGPSRNVRCDIHCPMAR